MERERGKTALQAIKMAIRFISNSWNGDQRSTQKCISSLWKEVKSFKESLESTESEHDVEEKVNAPEEDQIRNEEELIRQLT